MAHKHLIELMTEGQYSTVSVYFESEAQDRPATQKPASKPRYFTGDWDNDPDKQFPFLPQHLPARTYTYKVSHEMAAQLRTGDAVVVPGFKTADSFRIAKVWQVHAKPQIDFEADYAYKWIVQKVDLSAYTGHLARESKFMEMMREVEKAKHREAIRNAVMASVMPGTEAYGIFENALQLLGGSVPAPTPSHNIPAAPVQQPAPAPMQPQWMPAAAPAPAASTLSQFAPPKFGG